MVSGRKRLIWTIAIAVVLLGVFGATIGVTSTEWFCSTACHGILSDTVTAHEHSKHADVNCISCHMPVGGNALTFVLHKTEGLDEVARTLSGNYEFPLNKDDAVALAMPSDRCTQCHGVRDLKDSPRPGYRTNHMRHAAKGVACTICHNRTGHKEDFDLAHVGSAGSKTWKHADFMKMTGCFRCHTQEAVIGAPPGRCPNCHPQGFDLTPASHKAAGFSAKGHGLLASAEETRAKWLGATESTAPLVATGGASSNTTLWSISQRKNFEQVNLCSTCHAKAFCSDCHGIAMPHPREFADSHGAASRPSPQVCAKCHGAPSGFCFDCHHGTRLGVKLDPKRTWKQQHASVAKKKGSAGCVRLDGCHSPVFCAKCHANGGKLPSDAPPM
jgi:hypothetical protein